MSIQFDIILTRTPHWAETCMCVCVCFATGLISTVLGGWLIQQSDGIVISHLFVSIVSPLCLTASVGLRINIIRGMSHMRCHALWQLWFRITPSDYI